MEVFDALEAQWRREPPVSLLVAGFLGWKPPAEAAQEAPDGGPPRINPSRAEAFEKLREMFPTGQIGGPPQGG